MFYRTTRHLTNRINCTRSRHRSLFQPIYRLHQRLETRFVAHAVVKLIVVPPKYRVPIFPGLLQPIQSFRLVTEPKVNGRPVGWRDITLLGLLLQLTQDLLGFSTITRDGMGVAERTDIP